MNLRFFILFCILQSIYASTNYIIGGEDAPDGYAPYQCSMQVNRHHFCGCSIISDNWTLTSAYCLNRYDIKNVEILVGTRDILNGGIYHKIDKWEIHENYHDNCGNNIGAVRVKQSFDFNEKVGPIELETEEIAEGTELEFTAFGHRELSNYPRRLQIVKLNVSNHDECKQTYNSITCKVGPQHLCTFSKRTGSCERDQGGPIVRRDNSKTKLVGVLNFGSSCTFRPDGFSKVSHFHDWIKNRTGVSSKNASLTIRPSMLYFTAMFLHFIINRKKWGE